MINYVKQLIRTAFKNNGYNIHVTPINPSNNENLLMMGLFKKYDIDMILDIGASRGQYVDSIRKMGYDRNFISFEPIKSAYTELEEKFKNDSKVKTYNVAIGNKYKDVFINVSKCDLCSSVLDVSDKTIQIEPGTKHISKEKCKMRPLDSFYNEFNVNVMLKIDVQGFEKQVLMGAEQTLKDASIVFIEMSLVELYKGEASFSEIVNILEKKGFEIFAITPAFMDNSNGRMLQVDGLFIKKVLTLLPRSPQP
jgi:FkbM family methyltransferase